MDRVLTICAGAAAGWSTLAMAKAPQTTAPIKEAPPINVVGTWKSICEEPTSCTESGSCVTHASQTFVTFTRDGRFVLRSATFKDLQDKSGRLATACNYAEARFFEIKETAQGTWKMPAGGVRRVVEPSTKGVGTLQPIDLKCTSGPADIRGSELHMLPCSHNAVARFGDRLYFGNRDEFFPKDGRGGGDSRSGPWLNYSTPLQNKPLGLKPQQSEKVEIQEAWPIPPWDK